MIFPLPAKSLVNSAFSQLSFIGKFKCHLPPLSFLANAEQSSSFIDLLLCFVYVWVLQHSLPEMYVYSQLSLECQLHQGSILPIFLSSRLEIEHIFDKGVFFLVSEEFVQAIKNDTLMLRTCYLHIQTEKGFKRETNESRHNSGS